MADRSVRDLRREWLTSGSVSHEAAYLRELVRVGELTGTSLSLAVYAGHPAACAIEEPLRVPSNSSAWLVGLERFGISALRRATGSVLREVASHSPERVRGAVCQVLELLEDTGDAFDSLAFGERIRDLPDSDSAPVRALFHGNFALGGVVAPTSSGTRAANQLLFSFSSAAKLVTAEHLDAELRRDLIGWALSRAEGIAVPPRSPGFFDPDQQAPRPDPLPLAAILGDPEARRALGSWSIASLEALFDVDDMEAGFFLGDWVYPHCGLEGLLRLGSAVCNSLLLSEGGSRRAQELLRQTEACILRGEAFEPDEPKQASTLERSIWLLAGSAKHRASCSAGETCHALDTSAVVGEILWTFRERDRGQLLSAVRRELLPWVRGQGDPLEDRRGG